MVAVISRNRLEWVLAAYGGYGLGVNVPMMSSRRRGTGAHPQRLGRQGADRFDAGDLRQGQGLRREGRQRGDRHLLRSPIPPASFAAHLRAAEEQQQSSAAAAPPVAVQPDDLATLIYTSGTTGKPKG